MYGECSAKDKSGVHDIFYKIAVKIDDHKDSFID